MGQGVWGVLGSKKVQAQYFGIMPQKTWGFSDFLKFLVSGNCPQYTFLF